MVKLIEQLTKQQADHIVLVLSSAGIPYRAALSGSGWQIWVPPAAEAHAQQAIASYATENLPESTEIKTQAPERLFQASSLWAVSLLAAVHVAIGYHDVKQRMIDLYATSADAITASGEFYRTVTALGLHADARHLLGNMAGIALFGSLVATAFGTGPGWLLILLSGIMGNAASALLHGSGYVSIGASTAVFGAIGLLVGRAAVRRHRQAQNRRKVWLPLGGGLAFLAMLGATGQQVDLMAHFFGFCAGLLLGFLASYFNRYFIGRPSHIVCLTLTTALIVWAWLYPAIQG
jgi:membrane associated rhomboid family serine protease